MSHQRALLAAVLTAACVSCSSGPATEGPDLPAPPPPVFPGVTQKQAPPPEPRDTQAPAVYQPRTEPRRDVRPQAPPSDPHTSPPREDVRPAAAQEPAPPATIQDAAATLERKLALDPNSRETRRQLVHLYLAIGDWQRADEHASLMPSTTFEDRLLAACVAWRIGGPENRTALRMLADAQNELADIVPFEVRTARFCDFHIPKAGQFRPIEKAEFLPGEDACLYLSFDNFSLEEAGGQSRVLLGFDYRIVDKANNVISWPESARDRKEFTESYRERVRDLCVPLLLTWPRMIGTGDYVLEVTVTDQIARKSATQRIDFRIK
ncbi:MAG: tetratricopeptide repeat protein [Planctomycetota bacterium]